MRPLLCTALALTPAAALAQNPPLVTAPQVTAGPAGAPDRSHAPEVTGFRLVKDGRLVSVQTHAQVCYDASNLYVRFRCPAPEPDKLTGEVRERDGAVWQDEAVELFLDPEKTGAHSYQFIVNCKGSRYDGRDGDAGWNGEWSASAHGRRASAAVDPKAHEWVCALTIPFATLDRGAQGRHFPAAAPRPERDRGEGVQLRRRGCAGVLADGKGLVLTAVGGRHHLGGPTVRTDSPGTVIRRAWPTTAVVSGLVVCGFAVSA